MNYQLTELKASDRYKLLAALVVPRPIAWVSTLNVLGQTNLAPFSFFNLMGNDPPLVALGVGATKDTLANIERVGEFVINLVPFDQVLAMNDSAIDFPADMSEAQVLGLPLAPSQGVQVPRLLQTPAALEARLHSVIVVGNNRMVLGEVVGLFVQDRYLDPQRLYVHTEQMDLVGRMHGRGGYVRTTQLFEVPRKSYADWLSKEER